MLMKEMREQEEQRGPSHRGWCGNSPWVQVLFPRVRGAGDQSWQSRAGTQPQAELILATKLGGSGERRALLGPGTDALWQLT